MEDCSQGAFVLFQSFLECVSCSDILAGNSDHRNGRWPCCKGHVLGGLTLIIGEGNVHRMDMSNLVVIQGMQQSMMCLVVLVAACCISGSLLYVFFALFVHIEKC